MSTSNLASKKRNSLNLVFLITDSASPNSAPRCPTLQYSKSSETHFHPPLSHNAKYQSLGKYFQRAPSSGLLSNIVCYVLDCSFCSFFSHCFSSRPNLDDYCFWLHSDFSKTRPRFGISEGDFFILIPSTLILFLIDKLYHSIPFHFIKRSHRYTNINSLNAACSFIMTPRSFH